MKFISLGKSFLFNASLAIAKTNIKGEIIAGGIIIVNTLPGSSARLDGNDILVSDQGTFIIGFQRDPKPIQVLEIISENKVIEKSLDSEKNFESIDNANAYYSERYGWTLRKI